MKRLIALQAFSFLFLLTASVAAKAEYYFVDDVVYPRAPVYEYRTTATYYTTCTSCCRTTCRTSCDSCRPACNSCSGARSGYRVFYETPTVVYLHSSAPRRHQPADYWGREEVAEYAWVPYP